jgi:nitrogen fixation NifU-like protein
MYTEKVIEHFLNPKNIGSMSNPDGVGIMGDASCGDLLRIYIKVKERRIDDIKFEIFGCPAAIATSSVLTELAKGKTIEESLKITDLDIIQALGGLPDPKQHCSNLGASALHNAIEDYCQRNHILPKAYVEAIFGFLRENYGLEGDAHSGRGEKEVSILLYQHLAPVRNQCGLDPEPGSFAENLLVSGLDEKLISVGSKLQVGEALLKVEEIGKDPSEIHTYSYQGFSLLAEKGIFCRVMKSGRVRKGDLVTLKES